MADQSPEEIEKRRESMERSLAISALEGYEPTQADLAVFDRVVRGEITHAKAITIRVEEIRTRQKAPAYAA